ncbi:HAD-superfamily hydrolase, subfamily IA, variant 1 family protein [Rubellimicrobium mesophilum DSM 19309]|uniref:phosphoglycolate phosphatase n=1 Tax=Rubellimicrobium mesophilum DSM 19309 TaxID=442562 RepID=A0A017HTC4_9RHOB|nr:HAD family hydrolase [Rubellimicrobium mesophilum]EYD77631.1 HAD-superfamily hydrolase, subfamily IA, variant 1 family protein [Rubellimicrobium mesophilum DSM 19309]
MTLIKGIVFDKDGTLFDFQATWGAWSREMILAESGGDPAMVARLADSLGYDMGTGRFRPDSVVIASTVETVAERILDVLPELDKDALIARMNARAAEAPQVEVPRLREALERLAGMGISLGIATNDTEAPARAHLQAAGVEEMFGFIAGYDSGHGGKPGPGQLLAFAEAAGLRPGACAMVGDSLHDLAAARTAGMVGVGVLTGVAGRATLEPAADVVLGSIAELPDWIAAQG